MRSLPQFQLFFGLLDKLYVHPAWWWWLEATPFLQFLAKLGRKWLTKHNDILKPIANKCQHLIQPTISPSWNVISSTNIEHIIKFFLFGLLFIRRGGSTHGEDAYRTTWILATPLWTFECETVEQRFYDRPLAQHVWQYVWLAHFGMRIWGGAQLSSCSHLMNHTSITLVFQENLIGQRSLQGEKHGIFLCTLPSIVSVIGIIGNNGLLDSPDLCTHYVRTNKDIVQTHNYNIIFVKMSHLHVVFFFQG